MVTVMFFLSRTDDFLNRDPGHQNKRQRFELGLIFANLNREPSRICVKRLKEFQEEIL